jgi:holo-[acyl-carrier protein] synthase
MIEIERIRYAVERYGERFLQKIYTPEELQYCLRKHNPFPSLAVRFAVKEAVAKALKCGIGAHFLWQSASIVNRTNGAPEIRLDASATRLLRELGGSHTTLSLTHTDKLASAVVLVV